MEGDVSTDYRYDRAGRLIERSAPNSKESFGYDPAGRLSSQRLMGATQWSRQYQYDAAGQLTGIADNRSGQLNYRYDPIGRLLEAATPKGVESFRFDPAGNLLDNAPAADGHQDDSLLGNLLSQYAGRHYRYDSRGNLVEKRVNGNLTKLEWDSHNRLSRLTAPGGQRTDYHYDPLGRRIAKISQGQATLYGWDGDVLAFETRDEEAVHYLFEPDSFVPLAQVHTDAIRGVKVPAWSQHNPYDPDKDPLRQAGPEPKAPKAVYYYHTDHLGTPQALTDEQGLLALEMDYQAWGEAREVIADAASKAGIRNPFRFQGQYHDDESGLHYNRHRYYDPEIGRFISRDPIGLMGGINIHSYAPNPVEWVDPFGLSKTSSSAGRKQASDKPNQNAKCPCRKKWEVNRFDRACAGNVPGVGHAKYLRDPSTGMWWSEDQTGHGNSAWKVFDKNGAWVADADVYGDYMNKHKSEVGKNINFNSLKCKDSK
ncbi:RHS repeat domain-containing protein [Chromobacterium vaccinii]|uniref:RHS repeat domain-containing protein n=1 Tax=Chromobacterium vaccinii TaxID=1108595 RepID=UPI000697827E|nr:RHS repeat-associated core domain-containing protein [Chromobacterium vaccinii]